MFFQVIFQNFSLPGLAPPQVSNIDSLLGLIGVRFGNTLRYIELPCELIQAPVLHELANKCPNLKFLTLDFASAMQLHDFNDLNAFPCNLRNLTICLSEVIFMEGFMRKVYQSLSSLEVLHLIGVYPQPALYSCLVTYRSYTLSFVWYCHDKYEKYV